MKGVYDSDNSTRKLTLNKNGDIDETMKQVYKALSEKGYDPIAQLCGYLYCRDPIYITALYGARNAISHLDYYEMLGRIVSVYIDSIVNDNK